MRYGIITFENLISSRYTSYISKQAGYWASRIQNEPNAIAGLFRILVNILTQGLSFIVGMFFVFYFSFKLGLFILIILPFYIYGLFALGPEIKKQNIVVKEERSKLAGFLEESLSGFEILKVLCAEGFRLRELELKWDKFIKENVKLAMIISLGNLIATFIASIAPIGVLWYGGYLVMTGGLTLGKLIGINKFLSYVFRPIASFMGINSRIQDAKASLERLDEIINLPKEIKKGKNIEVMESSGIVIKDLTFSYGEKKIFDKFNLEIKGGKVTVILGKSGCGKSTLLRLIVGLLKAESGEIRIGGIEVNNGEVNIESLRKQVCLIPQNAYLFSGSADYNIKFGYDGKIDGKILEIAGVSKFLNDLSCDIGSRGLKLSGGQRQRIALARALIREPKILLMDEVTSEIDLETEREIIEKIIELRRGKTTVIIAHKTSAIEKADEIITLGSYKDR